jgi:hypothetical protein
MQKQALIKQFNVTSTQALAEIAEALYSSKELDYEDWISVIKKLGLTENEFESIMQATPKRYEDYPNIFNSRFSLAVRPAYRTARSALGRKAA